MMNNEGSRAVFLWALIAFGVISLVLYAGMHNAATLKETLDAAMRDEVIRKVGLLILAQPVVFGVLFLLKRRANRDSG